MIPFTYQLYQRKKPGYPDFFIYYFTASVLGSVLEALVFPTPGLRLLEEVVVDEEDDELLELLDEEELELLEELDEELDELELEEDDELELLDELELEDVLGSVEDGAVDEGLVTRSFPTN